MLESDIQNDLGQALLPEEEPLEISTESNLVYSYPTNDSFSKLVKDIQKNSCCIKDIYKRWVKINMENQITNPTNEIKLNLYKINKLFICEYCKNNCLPKSKLKPKTINLNMLMHNTCKCGEHHQISARRLSVIEKRPKQVNTLESNEIMRIAEEFLEKGNFIKYLEEEMGKIKDNESILLGVFNEIFYKAVINIIKEYSKKKKLNVKPIIDYGIKIFEKFELDKIKTFSESELKNQALLAYYLLVLLEENYNIFSIERNILYEATSSDFLFYSYVKKKKNILENEKLEKVFKNVKLQELNNYFFYEIDKFNVNDVLSKYYYPINFFCENCFFGYEYFQKNENKSKAQELKFLGKSFNAADCINENNLIEIFDDFMVAKDKKVNQKLLYINKDNILSNQLLEKILNNILDNTDNENYNYITFITGYLNFESRFKNSNKKQIIKLLDFYLNKLDSKSEDFKNLKTLQEIFEKIKNRVDQISQSNSEVNNFQYLPMIKRTLELFDIENFDINKMKNMDFSNLIKELIENLIIEKIASEFKKLEDLSKNYKNLLQIVYLLCINNEGKDYLYNSSLIQVIIDILTWKTNYDSNDKKYCEYFIELITILKLNLNRKIISKAFSAISNNNSKVLLSLFFIKDPIISDQAIFDFSKYLNLLLKIEDYKPLFENNNLRNIEKFFNNNKNKFISFSEGIKYILTDNFQSKKFDFKIDMEKNRDDDEKNRYYFSSLMICLNSILKTNFFIQKNKINFFTQDKNNKYDLRSFILSKKIPFFAKSLILDYVLKINMTYQVDKNNNIIGMFPYDDLELIEKENKNNLENIIIIFNLFNNAIKLLFELSEDEFKVAYIEQNGLYDFCFSFIKALNCLCNYVNNRLKTVFEQNNFIVHFCFYFNNLISNFLQLEEKFSLCFNIEMKNAPNKSIQQSINKELYYNYEESSKLFTNWKQNIFDEFQTLISKYFIILNENLNNPISSKIDSIYDRFFDYNNEHLFSVNSNDAYSYLFYYKIPDINENELIPDDAIGKYDNAKKEIIENFNKWKDFVYKQNFNCGIEIVLNNFDMKFENHTIREYFFAKYFLKIIPDNFDEYFNDPVVLNGFIKLIINDKNLINFENLEKKQDILDKYFSKEESRDLNEIKLKIIGNLIRKLNYVCNYEIAVSNCFCNSEHEMQLSEYVNSLILFIEALGENYNREFHEAMFEYLYDLENEIKGEIQNNKNKNLKKSDKRLPIAKYDETIQKYVPLDGVNIPEEKYNLKVGDIDISKGCSGYLLLITLYKKIFDQIYKENDDEIYEKNLLIISHSLSTCLEEFSHINDDKHKKILNDCLKILFNDTKIRVFLIYNDFEKLKKNEKLNFILNDLLNLLIVFLINDSENLTAFYKGDSDYISINHCQFEWVAVEYFKQTLEKIKIIKLKEKGNDKELDIGNIDEDLGELELQYKDKSLNNIPEFILALKYYEIMNILINYYKISEFDFLLKKNIREKDEDLNNYISKCQEKNLMKFCKYENKDNMKELRKLMYTFINKIYVNLEIIIDEEQEPRNISSILKSEIYYLSKETKTDFENEVDRSSKDTKLLSIYQNLDRFLFEMIYTEHKKKIDPLNYDYLELINFCFILLYNILLIIFNYKGPNFDREKYNEIDDRRYSVDNNILFILLTICHLAYLSFILFKWYKNHLKIRYFYDLNKLYISTQGDIKLEDQLSLEKKSILFKNLITNYTNELSRIEEFYPGIPKPKKQYTLFLHTILLNSKIISFTITILCIIFYYLISQIFLSLPILLFAKFIPTLSAIFISLAGKFKYIFTVYIYTFSVLYIFSFSAFLFLPKMFNREVVTKENEPISEDDSTEAICSSFWQCILYFINFGFKDGTGMDIISYRENMGYYYIQFFYESLFFLLISNIFGNIFTALITDAFSENREKVWNNEIDKKDVCFICQMDKNDCIDKHEDFKKHIERHSLWKYVSFLSNIMLKEQSEFSVEEKYIWDKMKEQSFDWFPKKEEEDDDVKQLIRDSVKNLEEKINSIEGYLSEKKEEDKENNNIINN